MSVQIQDGLFEVEQGFPRIMRYSLFVNMMSTAEACLVRLCRVAYRYLEMKDAFDDKAAGVIQRALKYLEDAGVDDFENALL